MSSVLATSEYAQELQTVVVFVYTSSATVVHDEVNNGLRHAGKGEAIDL